MAETVTIEKLREAVHNVDAMSQEGFREIKAVARLTMFALMTPEGQRDTEAIANALQAIWNRAEQSESAINWEAEQVRAASHLEPCGTVRERHQLGGRTGRLAVHRSRHGAPL